MDMSYLDKLNMAEKQKEEEKPWRTTKQEQAVENTNQ